MFCLIINFPPLFCSCSVYFRVLITVLCHASSIDYSFSTLAAIMKLNKLKITILFDFVLL